VIPRLANSKGWFSNACCRACVGQPRNFSHLSGMDRIPSHIGATLDQLQASESLRHLRLRPPGSVDFSSNDYLGLATVATEGQETGGIGAGGSRLLSGHHAAHMALEELCRELFQGAALAFSSGYQANLGLLSAVATRHDTFLYDQAAHASLKDGMRLSPAQAFSFRHNDLAHLEELLRRAKGNAFVVTEALFSMDGDRPDLAGMAALCARHGAYLIVDEAHSTGVDGDEGQGSVLQAGLGAEVFARVHAFGKAVGRAGAVVVTAPQVRDFLVNRSRPFIYTTAMPLTQAASLVGALQRMRGCTEARAHLRELRQHWEALWPGSGGAADSPIVPVLVPGNAAARAAASRLQAQGLDVRAILAPTVPLGSERLRIILHAFNTPSELAQLALALRPHQNLTP
jgi:8-amino-7-oxononanoate synthase